MNKLFKIIFFCFTINSAHAAKLEDVVILDITHKKDNFELKLQTKNGPKDSYFFVDIVKSDANSFGKLAIVLKKLKKRDDFKLTLEIPSFSVSPSGSYYRSESVTFSGSAAGESLVPN